MTRSVPAFSLVGALVLAGAAAPAAAAPACHASVTLVDFGRIDYKEGGDITGQLTVTCDGPTAFEVSASPGYGGYQGRTMVGPREAVLRYNLYVDPARRRVWGDGESGGTARMRKTQSIGLRRTPALSMALAPRMLTGIGGSPATKWGV